MKERVAQAVVAKERMEANGNHLRPEQPDERPVPAAPDVVGKGLPLRQCRAQPLQCET